MVPIFYCYIKLHTHITNIYVYVYIYDMYITYISQENRKDTAQGGKGDKEEGEKDKKEVVVVLGITIKKQYMKYVKFKSINLKLKNQSSKEDPIPCKK